VLIDDAASTIKGYYTLSQQNSIKRDSFPENLSKNYPPKLSRPS
jgi:hypothetical protein